MGSLLPAEGETPRFAQIYICDSDPVQQANVRMLHNHGHLERSTLMGLQNMLQQFNPYFTIFATASERLAQNEHISLRLKNIESPNLDLRRYNRPTASELAILIPEATQSTVNSRDIVLQTRSGPLQQISEFHTAYTPLRYPLLFPYGEQGYHLSLSRTVPDRCTGLYLH